MNLVFLTNVNATRHNIDILSGAQREKNVPEVKEEDFGFGRCNPLKSALVFGVNAVRCGGGGVRGVKVQQRCRIILLPDSPR